MNDFDRFICLKETEYLSCSWLFEVLVELKVVTCFFCPVLTQLFVGSDVVYTLVVGEYANDFVINLSPVFKLHDANDTNLRQ